MADTIVYKKKEMNDASDKIKQAHSALQQAGEDFVKKMNTAIASWEGPSKDKFQGCVNSIDGYVKTELPNLVKALAEMLDNNYVQMNAADENIAQQMPDKLVN